MLREGVIAAIPGEYLSGLPKLGWRFSRFIARRHSLSAKRSERLSRALNRLGPSYVKLGQFLATRPDVVGKDIAADLANLQDKMEFFSSERAISTIEESLNSPVDKIFASFGEPVAAASIAQVHEAKVRGINGQMKKVAVKVIRPGVRNKFFQDLDSYFLAARLQERFIPSMRRLRPVEVTRKLAQTTKIEMDLRLEAAALSELYENTKHDKGFSVPKVDWQRTGRDVLTLEWVDGVKLSDINAIKALNIDHKLLASNLIQSFLRQTLRDGFFHADMHPGNLFVREDGEIIAVDLGIMGRIGKKERYFLAEILYGFIKRDYQRVAQVHFEAGYVPKKHDVTAFAQAIRAIGEPIHGQSAQTISMARLLTLLFEVTELFDMQTRPELLLLQKTMVVVEGVARTLDPSFNMWKVSEPVVSEWIFKNLGPYGYINDLQDGIKSLAALARKIPDFSKRLEKISSAMITVAENGVSLDDETIEKIGKNRKSISEHIALWFIAIALLWIIYNGI